MAKNKFYNFSFNEKTNETDFYLYGEIINGGNDWKFDETDVTFQDVRETLDSMEDNSTLNMYINSPGGSVFCTQGIVAMLQRAKDRGITINAYIDGLGASCASWLPMVADNLYIYSGSILMIHKPMSVVVGNADEMKEQIAILDKIENDVILPLYMSRAKEGVTEEDIKNYMAKETWFTSNEILEVFDNITLLEDKRKIACCVDKDVMKNYINIPNDIKALLEKEDNKLKDPLNKDGEEELNDNTDGVDNAGEGEGEGTDTDDKNDGGTDGDKGDGSNGGTDTDDKDDGSGEGDKDNSSNGGTDTDDKDDNSTDDDDDSKDEENDSAKDDEEEEEENLQKKLKASNDKLIALNEKYLELEKSYNEIKEKLDKIEEEKNKAELEDKINVAMNFYKEKFEKLNAMDKFNSDEVQNLIKESISNSESKLTLSDMLVDMIDTENKFVKKGSSNQEGKEFNDLLKNISGDSVSDMFED